MPEQRTQERNARRGQGDNERTSRRLMHQVREAESNMAEHWMEYARENPGSAALLCFGIGFVLGWKLKPW